MPAPEPVAVVALGMVTPVGHGADASCAAMRAGIARFAELRGVTYDGGPVVGAAVQGVVDGLAGVERFARLATGALSELLEAAALGPREEAGAGLYLALPSEGRAGLEALPAELPSILERASRVDGLARRTRVFSKGHAGAITAVAEALVDLRDRKIRRAIVGGVDTLVEPETVARYGVLGRLKHGDRPVGLMPGEAAAFFLVEPIATAEARGLPVLATLEAPCTASEWIKIDGEGVCDASALTDAGRRTLAALPDGGARVGLVVSDLNGEPYRSEEFGYFVARALGGDRASFRLWHPADAIGDTGAAAAAISIGVAARALRRGYARASGALVVGSSDAGLRGSVFLGKHEARG